MLDPELPKQHFPSFMTTANISLHDVAANEPLDLNIEIKEGSKHKIERGLQCQSASDPSQSVASLIGVAAGMSCIRILSRIS